MPALKPFILYLKHFSVQLMVPKIFQLKGDFRATTVNVSDFYKFFLNQLLVIWVIWAKRFWNVNREF